MSCDNRGRLWETGPSTAKTSTTYFYNRMLHRTFADCQGMRAYYWNGYINGQTEVAGPQPVPIRMSWVTNLTGASNIVVGGSGPPPNQSTATLTVGTWCGLEGSTGSPTDASPIRNLLWQPQSYAAFVAAGGSVSPDCTQVVDPPGWTVATDPGPSVPAGGYYYTQVEQTINTGSQYMSWGIAYNPVGRYDGTGTNSPGDYTKTSGTQINIVYDTNWQNGGDFTGVSVGATYGIQPIFVLGKNYKNAKTWVIDGTSVTQGSYEFGDADGTSGTMGRALSLGGYPFITTACASCEMTTIRSALASGAGGASLRLGILQYATAGVDTGHMNNDGGPAGSWPSEGTFTPPVVGLTANPANVMALLRWWIATMRGAMPAGALVMHPTQYPGSTSYVDYVTATSVTSDQADTTLTVTLPSTPGTAPLSVGEEVIVSGSSSAGCNTPSQFGTVQSIVSATVFTVNGSAVPTVATCAGTIHVTDAFQSAAFQTAYYGPGNPYDYFDNYVIQGGGYAGTGNSYSGLYDPDIGYDESADIGFVRTGPTAYLWPTCPGVKSASPEGGHTGYCSAARAAPLEKASIVQALHGYYGWVH